MEYIDFYGLPTEEIEKILHLMEIKLRRDKLLKLKNKINKIRK